MGAPKKNQNAVKPAKFRADDHLHMRIVAADKRQWKRAARKAKMELSPWIVAALNSAAFDVCQSK